MYRLNLFRSDLTIRCHVGGGHERRDVLRRCAVSRPRDPIRITQCAQMRAL